MSSTEAIENLINGYATSEDSSFLIPNVTEDFLAVRPSGNPISAKGLVGMFDSKDLVAESSELIKVNDHKSHLILKAKDLEGFAAATSTPEMKEWDKENGYKDICYSLTPFE